MSKNGWQLTGNAPDAYEQHIVPAFSRAWALDILEKAALQEGEDILDVACGSGIVARHAISQVGTGGKVSGVDINEIMLNKAREISKKENLSIEWYHNDASNLPFQDNRFDVLLCQQGLQYFPERDSALKEIYRVITQGGRLVLSVWRLMEFSPFYKVLHEIIKQNLGKKNAAILSSAYSLSDKNQLRSLIEKAGFKKINIRIVIKQMYVTDLKEFFLGGMIASPYAAAFAELNKNTQQKIIKYLESSLQDYLDDEGLVAPMEAWVVSAWK